MPWGYAAVAGASLFSGYMGSEASKDAAGAQGKGTDAAMNMSERARLEWRRDLEPYRGAGSSALQRLMYLTGVGDRESYQRDAMAEKMGLKKPTWEDAAAEHLQSHIKTFGHGYTAQSDASAKDAQTQQIYDRMLSEYNGKLGQLPTQAPSANDDFGSLNKPFTLQDFQKDTSYAFRQAEGEKALTRAQSSRGIAQGTPGLKSLMRFNQDLASTEYGAAFSRDLSSKQNQFGMLQTLAGMGQNAAAMTGAGSMNAAGLSASAAMAGGNATAQGIMGSASAQNNAIQGGMSNLMYQQRYDALMKRMPVFGASNSGEYNINANAPS